MSAAALQQVRVVRNGTLITEAGPLKADVWIRNGRVEALTQPGSNPAPGPADAEGLELDATGKWVFPGAIDIHAHLREPGLEHKEDFAHGTRAAACGGVTTVFDMPNTLPPVSNGRRIKEKDELVGRHAHVDYGLWGVLTPDNLHELEGMAAAGAVGIKIFMGPTTGDIAAPDLGPLLEAFQLCARLGLRIAVHAENRSVIEHFQAKEKAAGASDYAAFLRSRPRFGEVAATLLACRLALETGAHTHIAHVTLREAVDVIRASRAAGAPVTAETCPHYLHLCADDYPRLGTAMKVLPPIREAADREALWEALEDGTIDLVASDHAPHRREEKEGRSLWEAAAGAAVIETMLPQTLHMALERGFAPEAVVRWLCAAPARLFGLYPRKGTLLPGADADLVIIDPRASWTIRAAELHSVSKVSLCDGFHCRVRPTHTVLRGKLVAAEGEPVGPPTGRRLVPGPLPASRSGIPAR